MLWFDGLDCALQFKSFLDKYFKKKSIIVYFHNLSFDFSYLINDFYVCDNPVIKDNQLFEVSCIVGSTKVSFWDSLKILPMKLANIPEFCGNKDYEKEVYPYELNTIKTFFEHNGECWYIDISDDKKWTIIKQNCIKLGYQINDETFDLWGYSDYYCSWDVMVLWNGLKTLKKVCNDCLDLNLVDYLSLSSIADKYLFDNDVYDDIYQIGGVCWDFI